MLIRSQDKKGIHILKNLKCTGVVTIMNDPKDIVGYAIRTEKAERVGIYSTEEKAMKVLDQLLNAYASYQEYKITRNQEWCQSAYYDMPLDSEVETDEK